MTKEQIAEFAPLWASEAKNNYVLESMDPGGADLRRCGIFDRRHKSVVLIEDPELAVEVMQRMVDAGVEIVSHLGALELDAQRHQCPGRQVAPADSGPGQ